MTTTCTISTLRRACESIVGWMEGDVAAFASAADDASFQEACHAHGVAPLLYSEFRVGKVEDEETPRVRWLKNQHEHNGRRLDRIQGELRTILKRFAEHGVEVMPLKGMAVSELLYPDRSARPMNDMDLLVEPNRVDSAADVLAELGYEKVSAGWKHAKFSKPENRAIVDTSCEHRDNPCPVEVHPRCVEQIRDFEADLTSEVWSTASRGEVVGEPCWIMARDVQWLYLLAHAAHHILLNNFRLIQLVDLRRLLPLVGDPAVALETLDGRATAAPLTLLHRYFPDLRTERLLSRSRERVSPSFTEWADSLDLYGVSFLNPVPWRG